MSTTALPHGPVIVGVDGSGPARDAVALGHQLADLLGSRLDVVTINGTPGAGLADAARLEDAGLIVLGHGHRRHLAHLLPSSARGALRTTPCPIAVAPPGYAERPAEPLRRVGVGFEPTPEARDALRFAHCLAAIVGGELRVIGVVLPLAPFAIDDVRDPAPYEAAERREVVAGLRRAVATLPGGVPTVVDARVGSPGGELVDACDRLDLLVCGSRRRAPLHTLLAGSVTERLVADAACPLVIVPRPLDG